MTASSDKRRVLIVDDEQALAWSLSNRLAKARPRYTIETSHDGAAALAKMHEAPIDLLVADVRMPGMSGIDLVLAALRIRGALPIIVMTAFRTADVDSLAGQSSIKFLEKPFQFEHFLGLVDQSLTEARKGFSGAISVQTLPDIVQLYVLSNVMGVLTIRHEAGQGEVWFDRGAIAHAVTSANKGEDAFFEIMSWSGGEFSMQLGSPPPERSVVASWQELLMESCRRVDEMQRTSDDEPPGSVKGWTLSPPPPDPLETLNPSGEPGILESNDVSEGEPTRLCSVEETNQKPSKESAMNIKDSLAKLNQIDGFVGAALVDAESGMLLGQEGGGSMNLEVAAAGNTEVVKAKRKTMSNLGLKENIEDILITLSKQYHMIRPLRTRSTLFFYVALDRARANLAMARIALADVEKDLQV